MPEWHQLDCMSGHVKESETSKILQLYALHPCQLDYVPASVKHNIVDQHQIIVMLRWPWLTMLLKNGTTVNYNGWPWLWWLWLTMARDGHDDNGWPCLWEMAPLSTMVDMVMMTMVDHAFEKWHHSQPWLTMHDENGWLWYHLKWGQPWLDHGQNPQLNHGLTMGVLLRKLGFELH